MQGSDELVFHVGNVGDALAVENVDLLAVGDVALKVGEPPRDVAGMVSAVVLTGAGDG
ncbi:hypothetical protein [Luteibacter sp. OK325]|uniref:hypothetical protein n=1 Tax=Luteibacter sp. OK325 TaxID=2135670 RepID=UPI0013049FE4|nr:hypothetical protein [Luteibacter sp. OK325]